jgi:mRNA-degrading endonuclease HigB of HigAB toxin-antitoxin module
MTTIKYVGTQDKWPEIAVTGKQSIWQKGQTEYRARAEADLLLATGLFDSAHDKNEIIPWDNTSAALQEAHDYALDNSVVLNLGGGAYQITSPVNFRTGRIIIEGAGAVLDAKNMTGAYAIRCLSTTADPLFGQRRVSWSKFSLIGPGPGTSTTGLYVHGDAAPTRSPRPTIENGDIYNFGLGVDLGDYAYLMKFYASDIRTCAVAMQQSVGNDSGENTAMFGGGIYNCTDVCLKTLDESSELVFHGVSFDYSPRVLNHTAGRIYFKDCHVENSGTGWVDDLIYVTGDGTDFQMDGGYLLSATSQPTALNQAINVADVRSRALFRGVFVNNWGNTANKIATGPGLVKFRDTQIYANGMNTNPSRITDAYSLLQDGGFEGSTFPRDYWSLLTDSGGTPTSRVTGANGTLTQITSGSAYAGTKVMRVNKSATGNLSFVLLLPVDRGGGPMTGQFRHSAVAGTPLTGAATNWDAGFTVLAGNDANGIPVPSFFASSTSASFTPTVGTWNNVNVRIGAHAPSYATHAYLRFTLPSANTGDFILDDISFHQW